MKTTATILFLITSTAAAAQQTKPRIIGRPDTAVKLAATDISALLSTDPDLAANAVYFWIRDSQDRELIDGFDFVLNYATSRADFAARTDQVEGGAAGVLLRMDRREWLPKQSHRDNFKTILEQEYTDPNFYASITKTTTETYEEEDANAKIEYEEKRETGSDGIVRIKKVPKPRPKTTKTRETTTTAKDFIPAITALAAEEAKLIQDTTGLATPILEAERWLVFSLRTLKGGLYYRLAEYVDSEGTRLDQKQWLDLFGASELGSKTRGAEELIGMWRSDVTAKPRRAKFIYGTGTRPSVAPPLVVITEDASDEQVDTGQHPIYNLFDFEFAATEILAVKPNGAIAYSLFAADGTLQDSAPENVVDDHEVPRPHTRRLEPGISCIRCHGKPQLNQWQSMPNDVKALLQPQNGIQIRVLGDTKEDKELEAKLRAKYSGDLTLPLRLQRDATEFATIKMVGWKLATPNEAGEPVVDVNGNGEADPRETPGYANNAARMITERFQRYVYDAVTPLEACRTLGLACSDQQEAHEAYTSLLQMRSGPVDPAIGTLARYIGRPTMVLSRDDWERVYPSALGEAIAYGTIEVEPPPAPQQGENENVKDSESDDSASGDDATSSE